MNENLSLHTQYIYFYWNTVDLQCYVNFYCITRFLNKITTSIGSKLDIHLFNLPTVIKELERKKILTLHF